MKRILTVAFCLLAIVAGLLYHTLHLGGTPFSPATLPQSYILTVLPLDSRPPCTSFVRQLGNLAGFAVELPPDELLDKYENAALVTELRKWLVTKITSSNGILISTDMTCIRNKGKLYEWTLFVDTFNNEIIAHSLSGQRGDSKPYFACLERLCSMRRHRIVRDGTAVFAESQVRLARLEEHLDAPTFPVELDDLFF